MPFLMFGVFWAVLVGGAVFIAVRWARALDGSRPRVQDELGVTKRLQLLEETIERQSAEIEQLNEQQRFLESLIKNRPALPEESGRVDHDRTAPGA